MQNDNILIATTLGKYSGAINLVFPKVLFATGGIAQLIIHSHQALLHFMATNWFMAFHFVNVFLYGIAALLGILALAMKYSGIASLGQELLIERTTVFAGLVALGVGIPGLIVSGPLIMPILGSIMMAAMIYLGGMQIRDINKRLADINLLLAEGGPDCYAPGELRDKAKRELLYEKRELERQKGNIITGLVLSIGFVVGIGILFANPVGMVVAGITAAVSFFACLTIFAWSQYLAKQDEKSKVAAQNVELDKVSSWRRVQVA